MKKYYLILLVCITLILFISCDITITHTPDEKEEPEATDPIEGSNGSSEEDTPTEAPVTYYHPELGVLPTMEELGLYWGMPKEELIEKFGEDYIDVGSGVRWYEWTLDDEKKLYVWMTSDDSGPNEYKKYYAKYFAIGTNWSNSIYIDEHLKDN